MNKHIGALAHLQLGRAYAMTGDSTKTKAAYKDFLTLWKHADPDIPILKQAKVEYAKLAMMRTEFPCRKIEDLVHIGARLAEVPL